MDFILTAQTTDPCYPTGIYYINYRIASDGSAGLLARQRVPGQPSNFTFCLHGVFLTVLCVWRAYLYRECVIWIFILRILIFKREIFNNLLSAVSFLKSYGYLSLLSFTYVIRKNY